MVIELQDYRRKKLQILPRNINQEDYLEMLENSNKHIVFATGPAGTGKTMMAVQMGVRKLEDGEVDRMVITRPAVSVDEQHGFLPGDLKQKMEPWTRPIFDFLEEYYKPKQVLQMIENKTNLSPINIPPFVLNDLLLKKHNVVSKIFLIVKGKILSFVTNNFEGNFFCKIIIVNRHNQARH